MAISQKGIALLVHQVERILALGARGQSPLSNPYRWSIPISIGWQCGVGPLPSTLSPQPSACGDTDAINCEFVSPFFQRRGWIRHSHKNRICLGPKRTSMGNSLHFSGLTFSKVIRYFLGRNKGRQQPQYQPIQFNKHPQKLGLLKFRYAQIWFHPVPKHRVQCPNMVTPTWEKWGHARLTTWHMLGWYLPELSDTRYRTTSTIFAMHQPYWFGLIFANSSLSCYLWRRSLTLNSLLWFPVR